MVGYTDDYGKMYYYNFSVLPSDEAEANYSDAMDYALAVPDRGRDKSVFPSNFISTGDRPFIYRKDSAEIPQFNFEVEFVSNTPSIMVGTGIAENNPLVRGSDSSLAAKLYPLPYRPNKFTSNIANLDLTGITPVDITVTLESDYSAVLTADAPDCEAWVIAADMTISEQDVVDEYGNETTQRQTIDGQVLLLGEGNFEPIYFGIRRQNNTCIVIFSDRAYKIPARTPESLPVYTVTMSSEEYQIPAPHPIPRIIYSVTMSDDNITIPPPSPSGATIYNVTMADSSIVLSLAQPISRPVYTATMSDDGITIALHQPTSATLYNVTMDDGGIIAALHQPTSATINIVTMSDSNIVGHTTPLSCNVYVVDFTESEITITRSPETIDPSILN